MLTKVTTYCQSMVGQCVDSQTRGVYSSILHEKSLFFLISKKEKILEKHASYFLFGHLTCTVTKIL